MPARLLPGYRQKFRHEQMTGTHLMKETPNPHGPAAGRARSRKQSRRRMATLRALQRYERCPCLPQGVAQREEARRSLLLLFCVRISTAEKIQKRKKKHPPVRPASIFASQQIFNRCAVVQISSKSGPKSCPCQQKQSQDLKKGWCLLQRRRGSCNI
jgi:hypothetical protein